MKAKDYFKDDKYWSNHINKSLEENLWIDEYKTYFNSRGKCLDLGCGIGQYSKQLIKYGYNVVSADISDIALNKVKDFNKNVIKLDMRNKLPFSDSEFNLVFANLSIHYFSDEDTKKLLLEIKRILKDDGLFIGSVNAIQGLQIIESDAKEIEYHFYEYKDKQIRLFDVNDIKKYLKDFDIIKIDERETIRFEHKKNYIVFIARKLLYK